MSDNTNNILNEEKALNESFNKLYEDWDKAGVMPHNVLGLKGLGLGKAAAGAAGLAALAGTALGKGAIWLGKQATMKRAFLKVLKRIAEIEDYVINGEHAENYRYSATLPNGKKISTIKHYDEIRQEILDEITKDTEEFEDFKNNFQGNPNRSSLNDQGSLVYIVNKYKKFFNAINRNFGQIKGTDGYGDNDENMYNKLQETIKTNLGFADTFVNSLITKFKTKYTVGKEDNPNQNKRLEKYVMALKEAWENVKKEILLKYKKLAIDICRSTEFKKLYDIVSDLYQNMPNTKNAVNYIMKTLALGKGIAGGSRLQPWKYSQDASNYIIDCENIKENIENYELLHELRNISTGSGITTTPIKAAVDEYNKSYKTSYEVVQDSAKFGFVSDTSIGKLDWHINNKIFYIPISEFNGTTMPNNIIVHWTCEFDDVYGSHLGKGSCDFKKEIIKK